MTTTVAAARGAASFRVGLAPSAAATQQLKRKGKGATGTMSSIPCRLVVLPVRLSQQWLSGCTDLHMYLIRVDDC